MIFVAASFLGLFTSAVLKRGIFAEHQPDAAHALGPGPALISVDEARQLFESDTVLFVDSRSAFDFALGHIAGATNIPLKDFQQKKSLLASIPRERPIVVYCDGAECNSSLELAVMLSEEGFSDVMVFFGGWREWSALGLPTESSRQ